MTTLTRGHLTSLVRSRLLPPTSGARPTAAPTATRDLRRTTGQALDSTVRAYMEPRFARDFSRVRVHTDAQAGQSARAFGALAYAAGEDVVFAPGRYRPNTDTGRRLLAHELTHVVQQADAPATDPQVSGPSERFEAAAVRTEDAVADGKPAAAEPRAEAEARPPRVQRSPDPSPDYTLRPSPFFLASAGSTTIDGFGIDSPALTPAHEARLAMHAKTIQTLFASDPDATIEVTGHTDATGTEQHNMALSLARAEAAQKALVSDGIDARKITAKGAGESRLLVKTQLPDETNRRVEVRFQPTLVRPPRGLYQPPSVTPGISAPPAWPGPTTPGPLPGLPPGLGPRPPWPGPGSPSLTPTPPVVPKLEIPPRNWLEQGLKSDPLLRELPPFAREKAIDALKNADVQLAEKIIDALPWDDAKKAMAKQILRGLLAGFKGKTWEPPTPPLHEMPPSTAPKMDQPPGVLKLPEVTF